MGARRLDRDLWITAGVCAWATVQAQRRMPLFVSISNEQDSLQAWMLWDKDALGSRLALLT